MPAARKREPRPAPAGTAGAAVTWCRIQGLWVLPDAELGVHLVSSLGAKPWAPDRDKALNVAGAVLLYTQPGPADDPLDAVAESLEVERAWVEGLVDGVARRDPSDGWLAADRKQLFAAGFAAGLQVRALFFRHEVEAQRAGGRGN